MTRSRLRKLKRAHLKVTGVPLAAAVMATSIAPAYAQEAQQSEGILEQIVVTAQKRTEDMQEVPLSIQAFGTARLEELHIQSFEDYALYLPSVSFTTLGPGFSLAYFRGVASGENNNHSGPQPSVGMYLDEQPITTIQGALDIHLYDIARVEALAGPQGTLYGASSQAGTIRIITNKPDATKFEAGYDLEGNSVASGGQGYVAEGFVNVPLSPSTAVRLVGWYEEDAGYIDEVVKARHYPTSGGCIENTPTPETGCVTSPNTAQDHQNEVKTYGARAALKIDLNDSWTITPTLMGQKQDTDGTFAFDPHLGDLKVARYYPENSTDKWWQAALTVEGRIGNFDLTYAGGYLKRDDVVNSDYSDYSYFYDVCCSYGGSWVGDNGLPLADPSQYIHGTDGYTRQSHEIRLTSPQDNRWRFVVGLFYQDQKHDIFQRYLINGLSTDLEVPGWSDTIWLTNQAREDKDYAAFGELTFDITDKLTATAGLRYYKSESSLKGFFGFNDTYSGNYGVAKCFSPEQFRGSPCLNLDDSVSKTGSVPRVNLTYHITDDKLVYVTYSEGFRPGGLNRNGEVGPYKPDYLTNYEAGWKTTWANRFRLNGAVFYEKWDDIQFSFLPPSGAGLTVIKNAGKAEIKGVELDVTWAATDMLSLSGGASWLDAKLAEDYIPVPGDPPAAHDGDRLPITPEFKANLTARLSFPIGSMDGYGQLSGVYNGSSFSDLLTADRDILGEQPSYTIADFSAGVSRDTWTIELYVRNLTDERARLYQFAQCSTDVCGVNPYYMTNQPRTYGLKFGQRF
jgi:outer membrane receptor protein involved in Fe transport